MRRHRLAGAASIVTFAVAIAGLEPWADRVLAVHMVQHLLLMVVVAPLAVVAWGQRGTPAWMHGNAFAAGVIAAQTLALVVWHLPGPFDAAQTHAPLHVLEHASFVATAALAWWVILAAHAPVGVRFAACLASAAPMMLLGALMTLAPNPWYAAYATTHGSLSAIADQQTAGALMWGPAGISYVIAAAWIVAAVVRDDEKHAVASAPAR